MTAKKCEALKNEGKYVKLQTTSISFSGWLVKSSKFGISNLSKSNSSAELLEGQN